MLVSIPASAALLDDLAAGRRAGPVTGFAATDSLVDEIGDAEEAERAATVYASIVAWTGDGRRRVVVVTAPDTMVAEASGVEAESSGQVALKEFAPRDVVAYYAEDPAAAGESAALAERIRGLSLDEAWETPGVTDHLARWELLWFGPGEIATVIA
ncbi:MAG: hypothetical protein LBM23_11425 [Propionibacteriaceae bacterium]|jgi:hypothetical protein|nr:hypothetical protein [Propionibacteriaceae bacterium]